MESNEVRIRPATKRDIPFITSGWLEGFREAPMVRGVPNNLYYYYHHKILERLLPRSTVLVMCNAEDDDQLMGFCCAEVMDKCLVLHYIYVKHAFRNLGVAKQFIKLLQTTEKTAAVQYTAKTPAIFPLELKMKNQGMVYNPYLLYTTLPEGWESDG